MSGVQQRGEGEAGGIPAALLEAVSDGIATIDASERVIIANEALAGLCGRSRAGLRGVAIAELALELDAGLPQAGGQLRTALRRPDGGETPVEVRVLETGPGQGRVIVVRDLSDERQIEERLRSATDNDPLTGLLSRRRFELDAERELSRAQRYGGGAMLVIGLDDFSHVNEELGHRAGDELLREVGELLAGRVRDTDLSARLGGDQFGILLTEVSTDRARRIGDGIVTMLGRHRFELEQRPIRMRASGGVVGLGAELRDASEAMSLAELAMRRAKAMGGGRIVAFEQSLRAGRDSPLSWSERIRGALETSSFIPHFQPILELETDTVTNWEMLIRMRGDDGELIPPDEFVPPAERLGLIGELDRWVVRAAAAAMRAHSDRRAISLEINLSGKSIGDPEMLELIRAEVDEGGFDPARVIFEVTETAAIGNLDEASRFAEQLLELGCGFALDDFGTGFASFYYLKRLPLTHLKIDGDFIRGIRGSEVDQLVVRAIVEIAHGMGLRTIAEYVEDAHTVELLREFGVDYCQGFEVGRPTSPTPPDRLPEAS
jgi:diguanylate cyclase (GGDEF)-like protein